MSTSESQEPITLRVHCISFRMFCPTKSSFLILRTGSRRGRKKISASAKQKNSESKAISIGWSKTHLSCSFKPVFTTFNSPHPSSPSLRHTQDPKERTEVIIYILQKALFLLKNKRHQSHNQTTICGITFTIPIVSLQCIKAVEAVMGPQATDCFLYIRNFCTSQSETAFMHRRPNTTH